MTLRLCDFVTLRLCDYKNTKYEKRRISYILSSLRY